MSQRFSLLTPCRAILLVAVGLCLPLPGMSAEKRARLDGRSPDSSAGLRVPVLGFIAQQNPQQLRPLLGTAGSAVLGDPLPLPDSVKRMMMSPAGNFGLAVRSDGQPVSVIAAGVSGLGAMLPVAGAFSDADSLEFSASGYTAVLYSAASKRMQVIANLPDSPQIAQDLDLSSLAAPVVSLAVQDDASAVLIGSSDGAIGAVYRVLPDNTIANVLTAGVPSALRFLPGSDSALLADSRLNQVLLLSTVSGTLAASQLAAAGDGVKAPDLIETLGDNRTVLVASTTASSLLWIDLASPTITQVPLRSPAVTLRPVKLRSGIALATAGEDAFWLVSGTAKAPALSLAADMRSLARQK